AGEQVAVNAAAAKLVDEVTLDLVEFLVRCVAALEPECSRQMVCYGVEGAVGVIRRTLVLQRQLNVRAQPLAKGPQHARLPDSRLPLQQYHLPLAATRESPAIEQQPDFQLTPHHRGQPPTRGGIEAAGHVAGPQYSPRARRLDNPFEGM